jgi:transcriptional regulator with XRE-family HTH domain
MPEEIAQHVEDREANMRKKQINEFVRRRIYEARTQARESQRELGGVLRKCGTSVGDLERGRTKVNAAELFIISEHYGRPMEFFFPESTRPKLVSHHSKVYSDGESSRD